MRHISRFLLTVLAGTVVVGAARAAVIDVNGAFAGDAGRLPTGWRFHAFPAFKPDPKFEVVEGPDGLRALRLFDITGREGMALVASPRIRAEVGDVIVVTGRAKGRGRAGVRHYRATKDRRWNQSSEPMYLKLSPDEWKPFSTEIRVTNGTIGPTGFIDVVLFAHKGADVSFADVRVRRTRIRKPDVGRAVRIRTLAEDSFEKGRPDHPKGLRIVTREFAPGIPTPVKMAELTVSSPVTLAEEAFAFPSVTNGCFKTGLRAYDLGGGRLVSFVKTALGRLTACVAEEKDGYRCVCRDGTRDCGGFELPRTALPADFTLAVDPEGGFTFAATSLAGTVRRSVSGDCDIFDGEATNVFSAVFTLAPGRGASSACRFVVDERFAAWEAPEPPREIPHKVESAATFDPRAAAWPVVFEEDFDGKALDETKWFYPPWTVPFRDLTYLDGAGHLVVEARVDEKDPNRVRTGGVWTRPAFRYGYFEARLKFTKAPAWWAAYWLYGICDNNAFLDGLEIDIFEDFHTRRGGKTLSHNMHVIHPGPKQVLKSWSFNSTLKGELDEWHTVGCKWTPFEISLYIDGRIVRDGAGRPVTFGSFETAACAVPLHAMFSGQSERRKDKPLDPALYPERFLVDSLRIYAWPGAEGGPSVSWGRGGETCVAKAGEELAFSVSVRPSDAPVEAVYLMDNGYLMDFRKEPPFDFRVPFDEGSYLATQYMRPGISGRRPPFDGAVHVFRAFVSDAKGRVSVSDPAMKVTEGQLAAKPRKADERFLVRSGDVFNFEAKAEAPGAYSVGVRYVAARNLPFDDRIDILVDGVLRAHLDLPLGDQPQTARATLELEKGLHRVSFLPVGVFNVQGIEFEKGAAK